MSIWGTLGEVAVGTAAGGAILGPGGAIIGGAAGLGGGDLGQGARDVGGWLVNTLSDADCLVCKSNPIWWETVAAVAAARAAGIINTPDDCAVYAQKGTEITDIVSSGQVPSSQSDAFGKCACKQVFGATGQVAGDAEKTASQQAALSANVAVHYLTSGGGAVSCVSRWADHLDIFAVSHGEGVRTAAWQPGDQTWRGWWPVVNGTTLPARQLQRSLARPTSSTCSSSGSMGLSTPPHGSRATPLGAAGGRSRAAGVCSARPCRQFPDQLINWMFFSSVWTGASIRLPGSRGLLHGMAGGASALCRPNPVLQSMGSRVRRISSTYSPRPMTASSTLLHGNPATPPGAAVADW